MQRWSTWHRERKESGIVTIHKRKCLSLSQAALATAVNEKQSIINEYEAGKAIPAGPIINKLNRALGVRLPKAKS